MTKQTEAMKLALDALEAERVNYQDWDKEDGAPEYIHEAITALQEALAEDSSGTGRPAQQEYWEEQPDGSMIPVDPSEMQPTQRKPLTDEQVHEIYDEVARREPYGMAVTRRNIARAIEAAHGIKGAA